jgi:hypothetical protein
LARVLSRSICLGACLGLCRLLVAQSTDPLSPQVRTGPSGLGYAYSANDLSRIFRGLNTGVTISGVHDSANGWSNVVTPVVSYAVSQRYTFDASFSVYPYHYAAVQDSALPPTTTSGLAFVGGDLGDVLLEGHVAFSPRNYRNTSTVALTLPSGNRTDGLGTGRTTFNVSNLTERYFGHTGVLVDVGGGDSSGLVNRFVTQEDNSVGPLAQFQAGIETWMMHGVFAETVAYEQLPIGDQKTYATYSFSGRPPQTYVSGQRVSEDNGFNTSVFIPLSSQITLSASYNRSLRFHLDTVSTGISWVWRGARLQSDSLIDRAMREAESGTPIEIPKK